MKKLISNLVLTATIIGTMPTYATTSITDPINDSKIASSASKFNVLFANYKQAVMVYGQDNAIASAAFLSGIKNANLSVDDIRGYALNNMSTENYLSFSKTLDKGINSLNGKSLSEKKVTRLIERLVQSEQREEANWISCGAGLGIGIPLMIAGVVTAIVALSMKQVQASEVEKEYINRRNEALNSYTNNELDRQDLIITYESDISAYNSAITELNRKIESGQYGNVEMENFRQQIAVIQVDVSDSQAYIAQLVNDQPQLLESYNNQISHLNELEDNRLSQIGDDNERSKRSSRILWATTAIAMPLGLVLTLGGANANDC